MDIEGTDTCACNNTMLQKDTVIKARRPKLDLN